MCPIDCTAVAESGKIGPIGFPRLIMFVVASTDRLTKVRLFRYIIKVFCNVFVFLRLCTACRLRVFVTLLRLPFSLSFMSLNLLKHNNSKFHKT